MRLLSAILSLLLVAAMFSFSSVEVKAQNGDEITREDMRDMMETSRIPIRQSTETTGTPFLFDDFNDGSILLANGQTTNVIPLRYNTYEQTLEFRDGYSAMRMDPDHIKEFELIVDDQVHEFRKGYDARRLSEDDFVRIIIDDQITFMAKHSTSFQENVATYGSATQRDEYRSDVTYYIKVDGDVNRIRSLSERRVMREIDYHEDEVERFAEENSIDFSEPNDVEKLMKYYNQLLSDKE